jgi:hypothetical protein
VTAAVPTIVRGPSPVEALLAELLDREWQAQSARTAPLGITPAVRDGVELVFAGTPQGIFAIAPALRQAAASPQELIDRVRDQLPAEVAPWTLRAMRRVSALRAPQPLLSAPAPPAPLALEPGRAPEPPRLEPPTDSPALEPAPPIAPEPALVMRVEPPAAATPERRRRAVLTASACGALAGTPIALLALEVPTAALGSVVGALAAAIGGGVAARARRRRAQR